MCWLGDTSVTAFQKNLASSGHDARELMPIKPKPLNLKISLNIRYIPLNLQTHDSLVRKFRGVS